MSIEEALGKAVASLREESAKLDDILLPELPAPSSFSYHTDTVGRAYSRPAYSGSLLQSYARAAVIADRERRAESMPAADALEKASAAFLKSAEQRAPDQLRERNTILKLSCWLLQEARRLRGEGE